MFGNYTIGVVRKTKKKSDSDSAEGIGTTDVENLVLTVEGAITRTAIAIGGVVVTVIAAKTLGNIFQTIVKAVVK